MTETYVATAEELDRAEALSRYLSSTDDIDWAEALFAVCTDEHALDWRAALAAATESLAEQPHEPATAESLHRYALDWVAEGLNPLHYDAGAVPLAEAAGYTAEGARDLSKLVKKVITTVKGHAMTVYVKVGQLGQTVADGLFPPPLKPLPPMYRPETLTPEERAARRAEVSGHVAADAESHKVVAEFAKSARPELAATERRLEREALGAMDEVEAAHAGHGPDSPAHQAATRKLDALKVTYRAARKAMFDHAKEVWAAAGESMRPKVPVEIDTEEVIPNVFSGDFCSTSEMRAGKGPYHKDDPKLEGVVAANEAGWTGAMGFLKSVCEKTFDKFALLKSYSRSGRPFMTSGSPAVDDYHVRPIVGMGRDSTVDDATESTLHELGHVLEYKDVDLQRYASEFLDHRVRDEPLTDMGGVPQLSNLKGEMGRRDDFEKTFGPQGYYVGRHYEGGGGSEIVSMGLQKLYSDPAGFSASDPEYAAFIVGVLRGNRGPKPPKGQTQ